MHSVTKSPLAAPVPLLASLLVAGLAGAMPVRAAAPGSAADSVDSGDAGLQEIVVHARRREESETRVPLAVSVISGADLADQSAVTIEDGLREIPNTLAFRSARSASALEVTMRGQTAIPSAIVYDPAVGLYMDGVYVAGGQGALGSLLDIDSVEVVRGAQGTLFGRNNTGGSISLYSHKPELGEYSVEASLSGGNERLFYGRTILNLPLSDTFAVRFAYQNNQHDGWGSDIATGQRNFMNEHRNELRFGTLWKPAEGTSVYFTFERFSANETGALLHPLPGTLASILPPSTIPGDFYQTDSGSLDHYDVATTDAYHLTAEQQFSEQLAAKLILGYRSLSATNNYDTDAEAVSLADVTLENQSLQRSAELQLSGVTPDRALDWVGGLYWFHDAGGVPSLLAPQPAIAALNPQDIFANVASVETNTARNSSLAAFAHGEYHLPQDWSLALGLRRTEDKRSITDNAYEDLSAFGLGADVCTINAAPGDQAPIGFPPGGPCPAIAKEVEYQYWSWEASLNHRFSDAVDAYLRAGRAQRSGGWNLPVSTAADAPFRPETLTDVELGVKLELPGHVGRINADVFTGHYNEMQRLLAQFVGDTPVTDVINAGRARVSGFEFDGEIHLAAPWTVQATFGYTDAKYLQFTAAGPGGTTADLSANQFYMTPKVTASLASSYDIALPDGHLRLRGDYSWRDGVQFNVINDANNQGSLGLLGARAAYTSGDDHWEVALFGTNLLDKQYAYIGGTILGPIPPGTPGVSTNNYGVGAIASWQAAADRRLYGIELTYRFTAARR